MASTSTTPPNPNPTVPVYPDDLEWVTAYLTIHMLSVSSRVYAYILWIAVGFALLVCTVLHQTGGGYLGAKWNKWALRRRTWRKKHSLALAKKLGLPYRPPVALPSNAQILTLSLLIIATLALSFIGPDYFAPGSELWTVGNTITASRRKRGFDTSLFVQFQPQYTIPKAWWTSGNRTGLIAFALCPLCVLYALKAPPFAIFSLSFMTQLHFDKLAWLHRWTGRIIWFFTTLHVIFWSVQLVREPHRNGHGAYWYALQYQKFLWGWFAYASLTLLIGFSLKPIRQYHYEGFYWLHVLFVPMMLMTAAFHHPPVWWWCWIALFLWIGERIWRGVWWLHTNAFFASKLFAPAKQPQKTDAYPMQTFSPGASTSAPPEFPNHLSPAFAGTAPSYVPPPGFAHAEVLPGNTIRVRLVTPGFLPWAPGQHFLLSMPSISRFASHPFTVASVCDQSSPDDASRELVFLIRAKKGWTKDLWNTVTNMMIRGLPLPPGEQLPRESPAPPRGVLIRACVDGPFGSSAGARWGDYSSVLIIAGGSGCSFGLSVLEYVCLCMAGRDGKHLGGYPGGYGKPGYKTTRVRFVWLVREFAHIQWAAPLLQRCMAMVSPQELQIDIFVTNVKANPKRAPRPNSLVPIIKEEQLHKSNTVLAPPSPGFVQESKPLDRQEKRHSRSLSASSIDSEESTDSMTDLSYYMNDVIEEDQGELGHEEHILDLTNFEGDDDTELPGEELLNISVKKEGRSRRAHARKGSDATMAMHNSVAGGSMYRYSVVPVQLAKSPLAEYRNSMMSNSPLANYRNSMLPNSPLAQYRNSMMSNSIRLFPGGMHEEAPRPAFARSPLAMSVSATPSSVALVNSDGEATSACEDMPERGRHLSAIYAQEPMGDELTPTISRPVSTMSTWSDANSISALISQVRVGAKGQQLRVELDDEELFALSVVAECARPGKPKLDRILADEVEHSKGRVVVGCCGPTSLNAVMRKSVAAQIDPDRIRRGDMRGSITLVCEDFEY